MPREWRFRIEDILEAMGRIERYTEGLDSESFAWDEKTVDPVLRNFGVIGEAVNHVPEEVCAAHPDLPWEPMRAIRNFVIHEYFGVSKEILWTTLKNDLPPLVERLSTLLDR